MKLSKAKQFSKEKDYYLVQDLKIHKVKFDSYTEAGYYDSQDYVVCLISNETRINPYIFKTKNIFESKKKAKKRLKKLLLKAIKDNIKQDLDIIRKLGIKTDDYLNKIKELDV